MATKFYLHRGTTSDTGTLPAAGTTLSALTLTKIATGGDTNRNMDTTIGLSAQTSNAVTTNADQIGQTALLLRCVSAPLAAQTLAAQIITLSAAISEANSASNFFCGALIFVWRPANGSLVGAMYDTDGTNMTQATTSEAWSSQTIPSTAVTPITCADGDILVCEIWRQNIAQSMSTGYANTFFYDGTTEGSSTNAASFLNFANTITFFTPSVATKLIPNVVMAPYTH